MATQLCGLAGGQEKAAPRLEAVHAATVRQEVVSSVPDGEALGRTQPPSTDAAGAPDLDSTDAKGGRWGPTLRPGTRVYGRGNLYEIQLEGPTDWLAAVGRYTLEGEGHVGTLEMAHHMRIFFMCTM